MSRKQPQVREFPAIPGNSIREAPFAGNATERAQSASAQSASAREAVLTAKPVSKDSPTTAPQPDPTLYDVEEHKGTQWVRLYMDANNAKGAPVYWDYLRALFPKEDLNNDATVDRLIGKRIIIRWAPSSQWSRFKTPYRMPEEGLHDGEILSPYDSCRERFMAFFEKTEIKYGMKTTKKQPALRSAQTQRGSLKRREQRKSDRRAAKRRSVRAAAQKADDNADSRAEEVDTLEVQSKGNSKSDAQENHGSPGYSAHVASIWLKVKGVSTDGLSEFVADTFFRYEQKKKTSA